MDFHVKDRGVFQLGMLKMGSRHCNILILRPKLRQRSTRDGAAQNDNVMTIQLRVPGSDEDSTRGELGAKENLRKCQ